MNIVINKRSINWLLALMTGFLLLTGCASTEAPGTEEPAETAATLAATTEEAAAEEEPPLESVLPSDAKIAVVYTDGNGGFTYDFLSRMEGYLIAAGVAQQNIDSREVSSGEMEETAKTLIGEGCSVLVIGNADPSVSGAITTAASEAKIPVLYFGTDPGKEERGSWEEQKIRAAYVGGDNSKVARQRAEHLEKMDLEKIDFNENGEIGLIVVDCAGNPEGNRINRKTLEELDDVDYWVNVLDEEEEDEDAEDTDEDEEEYEEEPDWQEEAYDEVVDKMGEYGKQLELIICAGEDQAVGAWNAVSDKKRLVGHDVVILGLDAGEEILGEIAKGNIAQTFFDDSMAQSRFAADYILDFLRTDAVPYETLVDYVSVTVDNAQEILDVLSATQSSDEEDEKEE